MSLVLVTGASGYIGPCLCRRLRAQGHRVRAVMRRAVDGPWDEAVFLSLGRDPIPQDLAAGVDVIFHLAGRAHALADGPGEVETYRIANFQSTLDLLAAARARGVRAFVYFSSVKASGAGDAGREKAPSWDDPYGRSKREAEAAVLGGGTVPHPVVLRPALVYGPNPKGYLGLLIRAVRAGWFPPLAEVGNARSMVHREDLAEAAVRCAFDPRASGKTYVVTDGTPYSTRQIYEYILDALGRKPPRWNLPLSVLGVAARVGDTLGHLVGRRLPFDSNLLEKLIGSAVYDGSAIERDLGFQAQHHLRDSMREMVETTRR